MSNWKRLERTVAKEYLEKYYEGLKFERVPCSGGLAARNTNLSGDVYCVNDTKFPYFIECKYRQDISLWGLLQGTCKEVFGWYDKAEKQARRANKEPMLIFRARGKPIMVMVRLDPSYECRHAYVALLAERKEILYMIFPITDQTVFLDIFPYRR